MEAPLGGHYRVNVADSRDGKKAMTDEKPRRTINHLSVLFNEGAVGSRTDSQLIEQFVTHDREAADLAFTVLVERYGPMVLRTGRSIVGDEHTAEDVFQATFLLLAMKAKRLRVSGSLSPWLHAVVCRIAYSARSAAARRSRHERAAAISVPASDSDSCPQEWESVLHEELNRLPDRYRCAILLCDVQGLTGEEAATRLNWLLGTVWSRLARGRKRLRERLTRRGVTQSALSAIGGMPRGHASMPLELLRSTVQAATQCSAGSLPSEIVSKSIVTLVHGGSTAMTFRVLRYAAIIALLPLGGALMYLGSTLGASSKPQAAARPQAAGATPRAAAATAREPQKIDDRIQPLLGSWTELSENVPNEGKDGIRIDFLTADPIIARRLGFDAPFICTQTYVIQGKPQSKPSALLFVDPTQNPPEMTAQPLGPHPGDSTNLDGWPAVYQVEGNTLRVHGPIRVRGPRPSDFKPSRNRETSLRTYQRVPKDAPPHSDSPRSSTADE